MVFGPAFLALVSPKLSASKVGSTLKEKLFRNINGRNIPVARINTFANALMFILRELKDILSGEQLVKKSSL